jgi:chromosomal replication initiation ATPase DnaA
VTRVATIIAALEVRGLRELADTVARSHGVTVAEIASRSRSKPIAQARHYLMSELRAKGYSFPYIARMFDCDHTSVIAACNKVDRQRLATCGAPAEPVEPLWQRALRARSA